MELKTCECKGESVRIRENLEGNDPFYWCECRRCKRQSQPARTEQTAASNWNNGAWELNGVVVPKKKTETKKATKLIEPTLVASDVPVLKKRGRPKKQVV